MHASQWADEWSVDAELDLPKWPEDMPALPVLQPNEIRAGALTFPPDTALGADKMAPRAFSRLSDRMLACLGMIFQVIECLGVWPKIWCWLMVILLNKEDGGKRPIGLFVSAVRVWGRCRRIWAVKWEAAHARDYFWGGAGKGCDQAAYHAAVYTEVSTSVGTETADVMLDLVKAFERVVWSRLAAQGVKYNYPLVVLRASLATYRFGRVVTVQSVCAQLLFATRGIVAGSSSATTELRLALIEIMDCSVASYPSIKHFVMVDDTRLQTAGPGKKIARVLVRASLALGASLERAGFEVSRKKGIVSASLVWIGKLLVKLLAKYRVRVEMAFRFLGADSGGGRRRGAKVLTARLVRFRARRRRYQMLRRAGVRTARLVRTGGKAAMVYGQNVMGVSNGLLQRQRRAVASVTSAEGAGKQLDLALIFADKSVSDQTDPAFEAHLAPIVSWARMVWNGFMSDTPLKTTVGAALVELKRAASLWRRVTGPARSMIASAWRLGWTVAHFHTLRTDQDNVLNLKQVAPMTIKEEVINAVKRWQWRRVAAVAPAGAWGADGPRVEPIKKLLATESPGWGTADKSAYLSTLVGGNGRKSGSVKRVCPTARFAPGAWRMLEPSTTVYTVAGLTSSTEMALLTRGWCVPLAKRVSPPGGGPGP